MKVKIFYGQHTDVEEELNKWLSQNDSRLIHQFLQTSVIQGNEQNGYYHTLTITVIHK